jgi:hypothetical protein
MRQPRILLWDLETSPLITYAWEIYEANAIKVIKDSQMLCFAFKWLGDKTVQVLGQDDFKGYKPGINNDLNVVKALRELFDEADVLIAHNGRSFDTKVAQARMIAHGLQPPSPFREIDTKTVAKRYGRFTSNKLDDLGKTLGLGQKLDTGGFKLWEGCLAGDEKSWRTMKRYNKQDVVLLEQLYLHLRPWIQNHPAMNILSGNPDACPKCGSIDLKRNGLRHSNGGTYQEYQCNNCGGYSRKRIMEKSSQMVFSN